MARRRYGERSRSDGGGIRFAAELRLQLTIRRLAALAALTAAGVLPVAAAAQAPPAGWQRTDLRPVTQPTSAGGLFLMYAAQGGGLHLVAVDPASGRTVWTQPASSSDIPPGEPPTLFVVGDTVMYLARSIEDTARLTAADARTGVTKWQTGALFVSTWPGACPGAASAVCLTGSELLSLDAGAIRVDIATGRRLPFARIGVDGGREIGSGLVDPGDRDPERLVGVRGARITWSRRLGQIFPGASTDFGWTIDRFDAIGLYVGSIAPRFVRRGSREVFDLARERTAGFRIANGRLAWRSRGFYACRTSLPCPGQMQGAGELGSFVPTIGVRTVSTGTFSTRADSNADLVMSRDASARLEGFAPATGRTLWRFDAGRDRALIFGDASMPQTGLSTVVLRDTQRRLRALDLATGARTAIAPTAPAWCARPIKYRQTVGYDTGDETIHDYLGEDAFIPCAAGTRRRLPTPAAVSTFVRAVGTTAAGLVAWADTAGLFARPAAP